MDREKEIEKGEEEGSIEYIYIYTYYMSIYPAQLLITNIDRYIHRYIPIPIPIYTYRRIDR